MGNKLSSSVSSSSDKPIPRIEYSNTASYVCQIIELIAEENVEISPKIQLQISLLQTEVLSIWSVLLAMARHEAYPNPRFCPLVIAVGIKKMIQHIYFCENSENCQNDQCGYYRELLKHSRDCTDTECQICGKIQNLKKIAEIREKLRTMHLDGDDVSTSSGFHSNVQSTLNDSTVANVGKWDSSTELAIYSESE